MPHLDPPGLAERRFGSRLSRSRGAAARSRPQWDDGWSAGPGEARNPLSVSPRRLQGRPEADPLCRPSSPCSAAPARVVQPTQPHSLQLHLCLSPRAHDAESPPPHTPWPWRRRWLRCGASARTRAARRAGWMGSCGPRRRGGARSGRRLGAPSRRRSAAWTAPPPRRWAGAGAQAVYRLSGADSASEAITFLMGGLRIDRLFLHKSMPRRSRPGRVSPV